MKKAIFEIPVGFTGAIVLRSNQQSINEWRAQGDALRLKVTGSMMDVKNLDLIEKKYLVYEARISGGASFLLTPMSPDASGINFGLFGGFATSLGEIHFFIGNGKDATVYFDQLTKGTKPKKGNEPTRQP